MKVRLINFHCLVTWGTASGDLVDYEFVTQIQKGEPWADLAVIRERGINP